MILTSCSESDCNGTSSRSLTSSRTSRSSWTVVSTALDTTEGSFGVEALVDGGGESGARDTVHGALRAVLPVVVAGESGARETVAGARRDLALGCVG